MSYTKEQLKEFTDISSLSVTLQEFKKAVKAPRYYTAEEIKELSEKLEKAICKNHTAKMQGMQSLSTSPLLNPECIRRKEIKGCICYKCFAFRQLYRQKSTREKLSRNTALLCHEVLPWEALPVIDTDIFRLEAFADLQSVPQAINYINICRKSPDTLFTIWTKNPYYLYYALVFSGCKKPENLIVIYSSPVINKVAENMLKLYRLPDSTQLIDKIFTVYTKTYAAENNININCGANNCRSCRRCYSHNAIKFINELLK